MKPRFGKSQPGEGMGRQEAAVWLGRSMSTHEVTIRVLLQLLDVVDLQQQVIQALYAHLPHKSDGAPPDEVFKQMDRGLTADLLKRISELRQQVSPILEIVDDSCKTLEKLI
jgi:hypothetical protein